MANERRQEDAYFGMERARITPAAAGAGECADLYGRRKVSCRITSVQRAVLAMFHGVERLYPQNRPRLRGYDNGHSEEGDLSTACTDVGVTGVGVEELMEIGEYWHR